MQEQQPVRRLPLAIAAGICAAVLAVGGGGWWAWNSRQSSAIPKVPTMNQLQPLPQAVQPSIEKKVEVYWIQNTGNNIKVVPSQISLKGAAASKSNSPNNDLVDAFNNLLAGPTDPAYASSIPKGTKLRSVKIREDGVHVDLSKEFTSGGGSASMSGRVAQVLYTATSLDTNAKVWLEVEGKKLEVLGGEGLELDQPMTRSNFQKNFQL